ncbi:MAG TPA: GNAT family N-acetyltransferase [Candidatus Limnocylindrales bacterium]|nr:GNAT family N-acetyltransferase [Candidatus Limnocylindrales bacterium]
MADEPLSTLAARNLADWHEVSVEALGIASERWPSAWVSDGHAPRMYFAAVLTARLSGSDQARLTRGIEHHFAATTSTIDVCDPFQQVDLVGAGFGLSRLDPWMVRHPGGGPPTPPPELEIVPVRDADTLLEFESTSAAGFEVPVRIPPFSLHAPAILNDPRMRLWIGRRAGRPVSVAMAYLGDAVTGVYGVATIPAARRHGYGEALAWAATLAAPNTPAVLEASSMGVSTYRRMGYEPLAEFAVWTRPPVFA